MYHSDEDIYRALEAGAAGYLLKETLPQELIHAIREVHAGRRLIPADILARLEAGEFKSVVRLARHPTHPNRRPCPSCACPS